MSTSPSPSAVDTWSAVCAIEDIVDRTGVCAVVGGTQVAVFRIGEQVYALDNRDPFSGANVISRGILGDVDGEPVVASPLYKQRFALADGRCLDDAARALRSWPVRVYGGTVEVGDPG